MISAAPSPRRWRPGPLLHATCAAHVGAAAALAFAPQAWPAALGAVVLSHAALTAAGLWPRSRLLGPNWSRLPESSIRRGEIAITIDDGPDPEVTPAVLDLLDAAGARATFFCIGEQAVAHPGLVKEIVRRGHAVENHSQHHRHHFSLFGPRRLESDILAAQMLFRTLTGHTPCFFRAPAGLRNPFLEPILARQGLLLASWTRRGFDTRESRADVVLQRLTQNLAAGDILLLHDGHAARGASGRPVILDVLPALLQRIATAGLKPVTLRNTLQ